MYSCFQGIVGENSLDHDAPIQVYWEVTLPVYTLTVYCTRMLLADSIFKTRHRAVCLIRGCYSQQMIKSLGEDTNRPHQRNMVVDFIM